MKISGKGIYRYEFYRYGKYGYRYFKKDKSGQPVREDSELGYLHSREPAIIYRDMKPSNVMLKQDGTVTLIDFGRHVNSRRKRTWRIRPASEQ